MDMNSAICRAQVYMFLSGAFLYPLENWTEDIPDLAKILADLNFKTADLPIQQVELSELQAIYRHTFGVTGSLCYETEYGLPHEFRQSQEMADLAGFYNAFGFALGSAIRERPDHLAVELEFMGALALKEAYAIQHGLAEQAEISVSAQRKFLQDHLGRWFDLFVKSLARNAQDSPYLALAQFTAAFLQVHAGRLGVQIEERPVEEVQHTPFDPNFSCSGCPISELAP